MQSDSPLRITALATLGVLLTLASILLFAPPTPNAQAAAPDQMTETSHIFLPSLFNPALTLPQLVPQLVAAGYTHTCAVTAAGGVKCWGYNEWGQLGDGTIDERRTPVDVVGLTEGVTAIAVGYGHTCALTNAGGVKCWGINSFGFLGDGGGGMPCGNQGRFVCRQTPVDVAGLTSGVIALSAGNEHACALTNTGGVKCWGDNLWGQLGDGTTINRFTPTDVTGLSSGVTTISTKDRHTCALMNTGDIKCWGLNDRGQLGDGGGGVTCGFRNSFVCRLTPVDVEGLDSGVAAVVTGSSHTCVLTATGGVKCWGGNRRGELGDGTSDGVPCPYEGSNVCRLTPVNVAGLTSGVIALSAAPNHTCVLTAASGVKCWGGYNEWGELGDGTTDGRMTPVDVVGLAGGVTAISAGHYHTCARTLSGKLKCWGNNEYGKLGDGTAWDSPIPIDVVWP